MITCRYGLELIRVSGSIQHALSVLKSSHPNLKAVCMGTRHTDPYSGDLKPFSPTDEDWPNYMRINCILVTLKCSYMCMYMCMQGHVVGVTHLRSLNYML